MKNFLFLSCFFICYSSAYSQQEYHHINSGKTIDKGIEANDAGDYEKAISFYKLIPPGDTNYMTAIYEMELSYLNLEKYDSVIALCTVHLKQNWGRHFNTYSVLGTAFDNKDEHEKAIEVYKEGIAKFPMNAVLNYNLAVTYQNLEQTDSAITYYKNAIRIDPFHHSSHLRLAGICANEKELTKAMLCFNTFLILEPNSSRSLEVLGIYNDMLSTNYKGNPKGIQISPPGDDDFKDIDLIINNRVALNNKYKTPSNLTFAVVKQNWALLETLSKKNGKGFWYEVYVPLYKAVFNEDQFNGFINYILKSSSNQTIKASIKKNSKKMDEFAKWGGSKWNELRTGFVVDYQGKNQFVNYYWNNNGLDGRGIEKDGKKTGMWQYFHPGGNLLASGSYDNGIRVDDWIYYWENDVISSKESYIDNKVEGIDLNFYKTGLLREKNRYKKGELNGLSNDYFKKGGINNALNYKDGKIEGDAYYYYVTGALHYHVVFKEGKLDGDFLEYYDDGALAGKYFFKAGEKTGNSIEYYRSGAKLSEGNYKEGLLNGLFSTFFENGKTKTEGEYLEGVKINTSKEYYRSGKPSLVETYDDNGKQNGLYTDYSRDGKPSLELTFNKGELTAYRVFDENGKVINENKKKGGKFLFENYYPNGTQKIHGLYQVGNGGKDGLWTFYYPNGIIRTEENYNNGFLEGASKNYYKNGALKRLSFYKKDNSDSIYINYTIDSKISNQGWYTNDKANGEFFNYYPDGTLYLKRFFVNDQKNGAQVYFDPNGKKERMEYFDMGIMTFYQNFDTLGNVINDVTIVTDSTKYEELNFQGNVVKSFWQKNHTLHGPEKTYYNNGEIRSERSYNNGQLNGGYVFYNRNGTIGITGQYVAGKHSGHWKSFYKTGKIKSEYDYDENGDLTGLFKTYYENDKLDYQGEHSEDEPNGESKFYSPEGDLQLIRYNDFGTIIGYSYNGKDGKPIPMIPVKNETVNIVSYYANGNKARNYTLTNGLIQGGYFEYLKNGTLYKHIKFKDGEYMGESTDYYLNGKVKTITPFYYGDINGIKKYFRQNGNLEKEETFKYDIQQGETIYFDDSGKPVKTEIYYNGYLVE